MDAKMKSLWRRIKENATSNNVAILKRYEDEMLARGLSVARIVSYLEPLYLITRDTGKNLDKLDITQIKSIVADIEKNKNAEYTKSKYKRAIKKFYQFLDGFDWKDKEFPERVKWIRTTAKKSKLPRPIILTKEEVMRLFRAAKDVREKALVTFMYESGCRSPDELLHMKVSDIEFDEYGAKVKLTSGKIGSRVIRVISCVPCLKSWLEKHPDPKPDNWLWVQKYAKGNGPISYETLKILIREWRKDAGIDKRVTPYTFRRTRYTHLATKIPTPALYKYMGQVQGSKVIERYVELNDEASDDAMLSFYGMTKPNGNGDIKPLFCSRCNKQNPPDLEFCNICHAPLTEKALVEVESKKKVEMRALFDELKKEFKEEMDRNINLDNK